MTALLLAVNQTTEDCSRRLTKSAMTLKPPPGSMRIVRSIEQLTVEGSQIPVLGERGMTGEWARVQSSDYFIAQSERQTECHWACHFLRRGREVGPSCFLSRAIGDAGVLFGKAPWRQAGSRISTEVGHSPLRSSVSLNRVGWFSSSKQRLPQEIPQRMLVSCPFRRLSWVNRSYTHHW